VRKGKNRMHPLQLLTGGITNLIALALLATDVYLFGNGTAIGILCSWSSTPSVV
jgi:hypothetical protein